METHLIDTPQNLTLEAITPENVEAIEMIANVGKGTQNALAVSPNGVEIAVGAARGIYFYNIDTLELTHFIATDYPVYSIAFSPDGGIVATGESDNKTHLRESASGNPLLTINAVGHSFDRFETRLAYSPDGKHIVAGGQIWEASTGNLIAALPAINNPTFSSYGNTLAITNLTWADMVHGDNQIIYIWDMESNRLVTTINLGPAGEEGAVLYVKLGYWRNSFTWWRSGCGQLFRWPGNYNGY